MDLIIILLGIAIFARLMSGPVSGLEEELGDIWRN